MRGLDVDGYFRLSLEDRARFDRWLGHATGIETDELRALSVRFVADDVIEVERASRLLVPGRSDSYRERFGCGPCPVALEELEP